MNRSLKDKSTFGKKQMVPNLDAYVKAPGVGGDSHQRKIVIIADNRESGSQAMKELMQYDVRLDLRRLEVGDFLLSERVAIERKTAHDFSSSIIDGRLFSQAIGLKNSYEKPFFLIEGSTLYTRRNIRPQAVMGAVSSLLIDYELPVIWTRNASETALLIFSMARREQLIEKRLPQIRSEKKPLSIHDAQEYIVAGLPHVERVLAKRLLNKFRTIERVFSASEKELQNVDGIGKKKSQRIREVVTMRYEEKSS